MDSTTNYPPHSRPTHAFMDDESIDPKAKYILLHLARYLDATKLSAYPSYDTLARKTGFSRRTVISKMKLLVAEGYLDKEHRRTAKGGQTSNLYTLTGKGKAMLATSGENTGGGVTDATAHPKPVSLLHGGDATVARGGATEHHEQKGVRTRSR